MITSLKFNTIEFDQFTCHNVLYQHVITHDVKSYCKITFRHVIQLFMRSPVDVITSNVRLNQIHYTCDIHISSVVIDVS